MTEMEEIKARLRKAKKKPLEERGLSTGLTVVNLALTGRPDEGFSKGCYYLLVGGSRAGKTFLALQSMAEAANDPKFENYRIIYDAPERGARLDFEHYFGKKMTSKLEWRYSATIEEFYYNVDDAIKSGKPFIYSLDSESSLSSEDEIKKFKQHKTAFLRRSGVGKPLKEGAKEPAGSYGDGKAKKHSQSLRQLMKPLEASGSILLIVSQTRKNIGFGAMFNPETRAGGEALTFYCTGELWLNIIGKLRRVINKKVRKIGTLIKVQVKKSRDAGFEPIVNVKHNISSGFDDVGSNIAYLVSERYWKGNKLGTRVEAHEFDFKGDAERLAQSIQNDGKEKELRKLVARVWADVVDQCRVERKKRYE